jgi:hypothetical protein
MRTVFFILFYLFANYFQVTNGNCQLRFIDIFNKSIPKLIEYELRSEIIQKSLNRFYIIDEIKYDTIECKYKFTFGVSSEFKDFLRFKEGYYFTIDSNFVVVSNTSKNLLLVISEPIRPINDSIIAAFGSTLYKNNSKDIIAGGDFWIEGSYYSGQIHYSICGITPILIFYEDRDIIEMKTGY